ncbi:Beta-barrel assembly-enhancing protease [Candidatus Entotheonellaceae bacterium PAL068K]
MTMIRATFYDGQISRGTPVWMHLESRDRLRITGMERDLVYGLSEIRIASRVGNTPRSIYLPEGMMCKTLENDAIDAILRQRERGRWQALIYALESRWGYVLPLLFVTLVGGWGLVEYGIPALAKRVAYAFPASADTALGRDGLKLLDQMFFSLSALEEERQEQLRATFDTMTRQLADGHAFRLEFRKSDRVGPNAFALPSGIIVVTDELVLLARHQNELIGVLAHEMGHVQHRHALRALLQNSTVALLIASLAGDITSLTALSAALPTLLVEAKYSRDFETEADQFALQYLREHDIQPAYFANMLERLEEVTKREDEGHNYLASHPATNQRIRMFREER